MWFFYLLFIIFGSFNEGLLLYFIMLCGGGCRGRTQALNKLIGLMRAGKKDGLTGFYFAALTSRLDGVAFAEGVFQFLFNHSFPVPVFYNFSKA